MVVDNISTFLNTMQAMKSAKASPTVNAGAGDWQRRMLLLLQKLGPTSVSDLVALTGVSIGDGLTALKGMQDLKIIAIVGDNENEAKVTLTADGAKLAGLQ